jgi:hypothetical protein
VVPSSEALTIPNTKYGISSLLLLVTGLYHVTLGASSAWLFGKTLVTGRESYLCGQRGNDSLAAGAEPPIQLMQESNCVTSWAAKHELGLDHIARVHPDRAESVIYEIAPPKRAVGETSAVKRHLLVGECLTVNVSDERSPFGIQRKLCPKCR